MVQLSKSLVAFLLALAPAPAALGAGDRVLHFPPDRSLGKILICASVSEGPVEGLFPWIRGEQWEYLGNARGDVAIPSGNQVSLQIADRAAWRDLSPLSELEPDDLYCLELHGHNSGGAKPGDTCMPHLAHLTGLRVLDLSDTNVTGAGMRWVSELRNLRRLTLPDRIDDKGLAQVAQLSGLMGLYFRKNGVTNAGLKHLAGLQSLEELVLRGRRITDHGLVHLARLPRLRYLLLQGDRFTDGGFAHLRNVPSLRILHFGYLTQTTDLGLAHLARVTGVQDLSFHWSQHITNEGVKRLAELPHLRSLDLANSQVDDVGLSYLKEVKTLEYLNLPKKGISDKGFAYIAQLPRLRKLAVARVHLADASQDQGYYTDRGAQMLAACPLLEDLSLGSIGVTDVSMETIGGLSNLRRLHLFGCTAITDEGLRKLVSLKNLETLTVNGADISISGLSSLNALPKLRELRLKEVKQDHAGLDLSGLKNLEELEIGTRHEDDSISDRDVACLADLQRLNWFQVSQSVTKPHGLSDHGLAFLAGLTEMDRLTIGGPNLTDEGLSKLRWMKKLDMLNIYGGRFTAQGLKHLGNLDALASLTLIGAHTFSQDDVRHLFETLPNLNRVQVGAKWPGQTILRERIMATSYRRARPAGPSPLRSGQR